MEELSKGGTGLKGMTGEPSGKAAEVLREKVK